MNSIFLSKLSKIKWKGMKKTDMRLISAIIQVSFFNLIFFFDLTCNIFLFFCWNCPLNFGNNKLLLGDSSRIHVMILQHKKVDELVDLCQEFHFTRTHLWKLFRPFHWIFLIIFMNGFRNSLESFSDINHQIGSFPKRLFKNVFNMPMIFKNYQVESWMFILYSIW